MHQRVEHMVAVMVAVAAACAGVEGAQNIGLTSAEREELAEAARVGDPEATGAEVVVPGSPEWGTEDYTWYTVSASSCTEADNNDYAGAFGWYYGTGGGTTNYDCEVALPSGSLMYSMVVEIDDTDAADAVSFALRDCANLSVTCTDVRSGVSSGTPGKSFLGPYVGIGLTIANNTRFYMVRVTLGSGTSTTKFRKVSFGMKLQVSPAPATATFSDVPVGSFGFQHIEALVNSGITAGCGGGNFCPDAYLTRAQMAIFLAKALGLHWSP